MRETFRMVGSAVVKGAIVVCAAVATASAQTDAAVSANTPKPVADAKAPAVATPAMAEFRKAGIGTSAEDLKKAWGKPEIEDKDGFVYEFGDNEVAQVAIDADKKVTTIAVTFREGASAPKAEEVFGPGEKIEVREGGGIFHMVRYPEAGYWVSYSSQGEGKPVTLMYRKL